MDRGSIQRNRSRNDRIDETSAVELATIIFHCLKNRTFGSYVIYTDDYVTNILRYHIKIHYLYDWINVYKVIYFLIKKLFVMLCLAKFMGCLFDFSLSHVWIKLLYGLIVSV